MAKTGSRLSRGHLPPKAREAFCIFASNANTEALHPLDWERFYQFIAVCQTTRADPGEEGMEALLLASGFSAEYAEEIAQIYFHLREYARNKKRFP
jgi:hypothetical protein